MDIRNKIGEGLKEKDKMLLSQTLSLLKDIPELGFLLKAEKEIPKLIKDIFQDHGQLFIEQDKTEWTSAASRLEKTIKNFSNKTTEARFSLNGIVM